MKYRVHQFVMVRVPVEIEADSVLDAVKKADLQFDPRYAREGECTDEFGGYQVDPLREDGEVDYENAIFCEWDKGELLANGEPLREGE